MWSKAFWKDAAERTVGTTAASLAASLPAVGLLEVDWLAALSVSGMAGLLTLLKALAAHTVGDPDTGGVVNGQPQSK